MKDLQNYVSVDRVTKIMLTELKDECFRYIKLANQIEIDGLTNNQLSNILGELTASVAHISIHSETLKEVIEV